VTGCHLEMGAEMNLQIGYRRTGKPAPWVPGGTLAAYEGILREGHRTIWRCGHNHDRIYQAQQCAAAQKHAQEDGHAS
jgi:hypothetical protein